MGRHEPAVRFNRCVAVLARIRCETLQLFERVVHRHERAILGPGDFALGDPKRLDFHSDLGPFVFVPMSFLGWAAHLELATRHWDHFETYVGA
jgi:hypothetical protein